MCAGLFYVVGQLSFGKQYNDFSEFSSGAEVIRKGTDRCSFNAASTCSICTFTPPVLIVLSFLPRMRNWFCPFISAMSLVTSSFRKFRERISPRCFLYSDGSVCSRKGCTSLKLQDRSVCVGQCVTRFRSCRR